MFNTSGKGTNNEENMSVFLGRSNYPVCLLLWKAVMNHGIPMD